MTSACGPSTLAFLLVRYRTSLGQCVCVCVCVCLRVQVFFYKRAQIFVGDVYGAFQGKGLGAFRDMELITMFADYRVSENTYVGKDEMQLLACGSLGV